MPFFVKDKRHSTVGILYLTNKGFSNIAGDNRGPLDRRRDVVDWNKHRCK